MLSGSNHPTSSRSARIVPILLALIVGFVCLLKMIQPAGNAAMGDSRGEILRVQKGLSDHLDLMPAMAAPRLPLEVASSIREFCGQYDQESAAIDRAGHIPPIVAQRLARAGDLMNMACLLQGRLATNRVTPRELRRIGADFRTNAQQALSEIRLASKEFDGVPAGWGHQAAWLGQAGLLLALFGAALAGLAYLAWRLWGAGAGAPLPLPSAPAAASATPSGQWMRTAMEASSEGIVTIEPDGERIRSANAAAERLLGYGRGEMAGLGVDHLAPGLIAGASTHGIREDTVIRRRDGEPIVRRVSWFRRQGATANAPTIVFIQQPAAPPAPVTETVEELRPRPAGLAAVANAELDAATVSLLENEILLVTGYSEVALSNLAPDHPMRADIEQLTRAAARAALLCREAAVGGRPASRKDTEPVALNGFIGDFDLRLRPMLEPGTEVQIRTGPTPGTVSANVSLLEQALLSLLFHALPSVRQPHLIRIATTASNKIELSIETREAADPGWRRVMGERTLPRAAAWLAAMGATLDREASERGGHRFRIHLMPAALAPSSTERRFKNAGVA